jgi:CelD/BcsL family acetyltransferase involved in cellulose biosynthesis
MSNLRTRLLSGFLDPQFDAESWQQVMLRGDTQTIFQTWHWLRAWWESMGEGDLLLVAAEREGQTVALAPLYVHNRMVYFVGSGESDYLNFIGDISDPDVLVGLLTATREGAPGFLGFEFFQVPAASRTGLHLQRAAERLGLECELLKDYLAVEIDLAGQIAAVEAAVSHSMLKREAFFRRHGAISIRQLTDPASIRPLLPAFYAQHVARWNKKGQCSPFVELKQRALLERFLEVAADTDWIRFLTVEWEGNPLASEFAWYYRGTHYSGPWCFDIKQANHSPGHVMLRQSLLSALAAGLRSYDLGLGDQEYKLRLPARVKSCCSWGLYPP